ATIPAGLQPRAALALSCIPLLYALEKIGLVKDVDLAVTEAALTLQSLREGLARETGQSDNLAKQIAALAHDRIPLIYTGPELTEPAGVRWRGQFSENGKTLCYSSVFPEMNHNELVGWSRPTDRYRESLAVILLRDEADHPRVQLRMDLFAATIREAGAPLQEVSSAGGGRLTRLLSLIQIGDFVSYYLSVLNGVDPTPVTAIENLKRELARR
ncbi:MAG TPA: SIS domain-containing protein, partial [candidate division Zixibacteria bacterium]|nr:SIS domain-containing protein [candidate division Zixibacteria bacterium]